MFFVANVGDRAAVLHLPRDLPNSKQSFTFGDLSVNEKLQFVTISFIFVFTCFINFDFQLNYSFLHAQYSL